jgi:hypothetical protein
MEPWLINFLIPFWQTAASALPRRILAYIDIGIGIDIDIDITTMTTAVRRSHRSRKQNHTIYDDAKQSKEARDALSPLEGPSRYGVTREAIAFVQVLCSRLA